MQTFGMVVSIVHLHCLGRPVAGCVCSVCGSMILKIYEDCLSGLQLSLQRPGELFRQQLFSAIPFLFHLWNRQICRSGFFASYFSPPGRNTKACLAIKIACRGFDKHFAQGTYECLAVSFSFEENGCTNSFTSLSALLGNLLINFIQELSVEYNKYLIGEKIPPIQHECFCLPKLPPGQCSICRSRNPEVVYK